MKSNYSALAERIELQWSNGLYVPLRTPSGPEQAARNDAVDVLFLELLARSAARRESLSATRTDNNFGRPCSSPRLPRPRLPITAATTLSALSTAISKPTGSRSSLMARHPD